MISWQAVLAVMSPAVLLLVMHTRLTWGPSGGYCTLRPFRESQSAPALTNATLTILQVRT